MQQSWLFRRINSATLKLVKLVINKRLTLFDPHLQTVQQIPSVSLHLRSTNSMNRVQSPRIGAVPASVYRGLKPRSIHSRMFCILYHCETARRIEPFPSLPLPRVWVQGTATLFRAKASAHPRGAEGQTRLRAASQGRARNALTEHRNTSRRSSGKKRILQMVLSGERNSILSIDPFKLVEIPFCCQVRGATLEKFGWFLGESNSKAGQLPQAWE